MNVFQCEACGQTLAFKTTVCSRCLSTRLVAKVVPVRGTLASWTTIRRAPLGYPVAAPYDVVVVDLEPGVRVTGRLSPDSTPPRMGAVVRQVGEEDQCPIFSVSDETA